MRSSASACRKSRAAWSRPSRDPPVDRPTAPGMRAANRLNRRCPIFANVRSSLGLPVLTTCRGFANAPKWRQPSTSADPGVPCPTDRFSWCGAARAGCERQRASSWRLDMANVVAKITAPASQLLSPSAGSSATTRLFRTCVPADLARLRGRWLRRNHSVQQPAAKAPPSGANRDPFGRWRAARVAVGVAGRSSSNLIRPRPCPVGRPNMVPLRSFRIPAADADGIRRDRQEPAEAS